VIADDTDSFAHAVADLLNNPAKRAEMGACAKQIVKAQYDWSVLIPHLLATYKEAGIG
jgi:glycosyltransferase involved in cell wall biosynthesis